MRQDLQTIESLCQGCQAHVGLVRNLNYKEHDNNYAVFDRVATTEE